MSLLRLRLIPRLQQSRKLRMGMSINSSTLSSGSSNVHIPHAKVTAEPLSNCEKYYRWKRRALNCGAVGGLTLFIVSVLYVYNLYVRDEFKLDKKVKDRFRKGCEPKGLREDKYIKREVHHSITEALCDKNDTDGMFGVVFGAAGTGKSNVLRNICKERFDRVTKDSPSGVLYVELGSDKRFAHKIAETCNIPLEPSIIEVVITRIFPTWQSHLTLCPKDEVTNLAQVFSVIEKGGQLYKKESSFVPVLIIDGADIVAKNNKKLFDALVEWAKKCANEDSVLVVMGSSDGHVLRYLDKQACKSRAAPFIEVTDFPQWEDVKELFEKHQVPPNVSKYMFEEITGGRLTDIYKAISLYKKLNSALKAEYFTEKVKKELNYAFESEIKQALNKAMDDPSNKLQLEIAAAVVDRSLLPGNHTLSVHELALELVQHGVATSIPVAMQAVEKFVDNNIMRYNVNHELVAHSKMAGKVLQDLVTSSGIQQRRCWQDGCLKKVWNWFTKPHKHHGACECRLDTAGWVSTSSDSHAAAARA